MNDEWYVVSVAWGTLPFCFKATKVGGFAQEGKAYINALVDQFASGL
jgi:hypothetical protein